MYRTIQKLFKNILQVITPVKPFLEAISQVECSIASKWARSAHKRLMNIQWNIHPQPENFDHHIDAFYLWFMSRNSQWLERGVYSALCLKRGGTF